MSGLFVQNNASSGSFRANLCADYRRPSEKQRIKKIFDFNSPPREVMRRHDHAQRRHTMNESDIGNPALASSSPNMTDSIPLSRSNWAWEQETDSPTMQAIREFFLGRIPFFVDLTLGLLVEMFSIVLYARGVDNSGEDLSYRHHDEEKWLFYGKVSVSMFFALQWAWYMLLRRYAFFSVFSLINVVTSLNQLVIAVTSIWVDDITETYVPFLIRIWLVRDFLLRLSAFFVEVGLSKIVYHEIAKNVSYMLALLVTCADMFRVTETFSIRYLQMNAAFYQMVVTFSTVGYGDIFPTSRLSQTTVMVCIFLATAFLPVFLNRMQELFGVLMKKRVFTYNRKHVLIIGSFSFREVLLLLKEFCYLNQKSLLVFVAEEIPPKLFDIEIHPYYRHRVMFIEGSVQETETLQRVKAFRAEAAIILSDRAAIANRGDYAALLLSYALAKKEPTLPQYLWLKHGQHDQLLRSAFMTVHKQRLKKTLTGIGMRFPGVIPFVVNILTYFKSPVHLSAEKIFDPKNYDRQNLSVNEPFGREKKHDKDEGESGHRRHSRGETREDINSDDDQNDAVPSNPRKQPWKDEYVYSRTQCLLPMRVVPIMDGCTVEEILFQLRRDYLLLLVGIGNRLDKTVVVNPPKDRKINAVTDVLLVIAPGPSDVEKAEKVFGSVRAVAEVMEVSDSEEDEEDTSSSVLDDEEGASEDVGSTRDITELPAISILAPGSKEKKFSEDNKGDDKKEENKKNHLDNSNSGDDRTHPDSSDNTAKRAQQRSELAMDRFVFPVETKNNVTEDQASGKEHQNGEGDKKAKSERRCSFQIEGMEGLKEVYVPGVTATKDSETASTSSDSFADEERKNHSFVPPLAEFNQLSSSLNTDPYALNSYADDPGTPIPSSRRPQRTPSVMHFLTSSQIEREDEVYIIVDESTSQCRPSRSQEEALDQDRWRRENFLLLHKMISPDAGKQLEKSKSFMIRRAERLVVTAEKNRIVKLLCRLDESSIHIPKEKIEHIEGSGLRGRYLRQIEAEKAKSILLTNTSEGSQEFGDAPLIAGNRRLFAYLREKLYFGEIHAIRNDFVCITELHDAANCFFLGPFHVDREWMHLSEEDYQYSLAFMNGSAMATDMLQPLLIHALHNPFVVGFVESLLQLKEQYDFHEGGGREASPTLHSKAGSTAVQSVMLKLAASSNTGIYRSSPDRRPSTTQRGSSSHLRETLANENKEDDESRGEEKELPAHRFGCVENRYFHFKNFGSAFKAIYHDKNALCVGVFRSLYVSPATIVPVRYFITNPPGSMPLFLDDMLYFFT